ncbi:hypothetical protein [Ekhidna sp.]|jgi:hypothetical protein|uniref:hypothetical protein n=1 Tax=Ekhidna sp. TaxID=2608089 RepID=UPI0032ED502C
MSKSLSELTDDLKNAGFVPIEILKNLDVKIGENIISDHSELKIVDCFNFESGTSASEEDTVYTIQSTKGDKGYFIIGFGGHIDTGHAELLNDLLRKSGHR